ncbi:MAG TPA: PKD domain-containing protein [Blastocatellia bacterium]|jgi:PKD repeat protein|nr:PKD domain-containing protein [Blastocatellia bacterium]
MTNRKTFASFFTFVFLFLVGAVAAEARTIYVSPAGNDNNPGTQASPVATPGRAVQIAASGDTIYLRSGRYTINRGITISLPGITLASAPGEQAAIQGGTDDNPSNPSSVVTIIASSVVLSDLEIQGGIYYGVKIDPGDSTSTNNVVVKRCFVHHTGRDGIKTLNADNLLVEDCEVSNTGIRADNAEGIDSIGSIGLTIRRCYIHDTRTTGIYLKGGARDGVVERCRVVNAGHSGILLGQDTDEEYMRDGTQYEAINCIARNNLIIGTTGAGIGSYSGNSVRFENNTVFDAARTNQSGFYVVMNSRDVPARQVTFKNNVLVMSSSRPMIFTVSMAGPLVCDSNLYYRPNGGSYRFSRETSTTFDTWEGLSAWQGAANVDRNSLVADPLLQPSNQYAPAVGSPAIDRGESIGEVSADYAGVSRPQGRQHDIGAHERASSSTPPPANQPPTVSVAASAIAGQAPLTVNFTATAADSDGRVASYSWAFGDGQTSTDVSPSHLYRTAGAYAARITVTDNGGATASASVNIVVNSGTSNQPPQVRVVVTPPTGVAPFNVKFVTTASDPDGRIVGYGWNFGDGEISKEPSPVHTYRKAGVYSAVITVTDNKGATATHSTTINATDGTSTTAQPVAWKNVKNATVNGNSVTKTAESMWGNSGAASTQAIQSGDGYIEFTAVQTSNERFVGLSNSDPDFHYRSTDFGIHLNTGRAFYVYEKGQARGYFGDFNSGDRFRVAVIGGRVQYLRNGVAFYTSSVAPKYPLLADVALMGEGSKVDNAMIGGALVSGLDLNASPVVQVLAPTSGEAMKAGSAYEITWTVNGNGIWRQDLQLSIDGGETWQEIAVMLPGTATSYSWKVPKRKTTRGMVRIVSYGADEKVGEGSNDDYFTIKSKKKAAN